MFNLLCDIVFIFDIKALRKTRLSRSLILILEEISLEIFFLVIDNKLPSNKYYYNSFRFNLSKPGISIKSFTIFASTISLIS